MDETLRSIRLMLEVNNAMLEVDKDLIKEAHWNYLKEIVFTIGISWAVIIAIWLPIYIYTR